MASLEPDEREEPPKRARRPPRSNRSQTRSIRAIRGRHVVLASVIALAVTGWLFLAYGPALPEAPTNQAGGATPPPQASESPRPERKPPAPAKPLSETEAKKIWKTYRTTIETASLNQDAKALEDAEDGIALRMTRTRQQLDREAEAEPQIPPGSGKPRFVIPRAGRWFAVLTKDRQATVLAETPDGWRGVAAVSTKGQRLPGIAKDKDGYAVPVGDADRLGSVTPRSAADGLAGYFSVPAGKHAGLRFKPGPLTTQTRKRIDDWREQWAKSPESWDARRTEVVQRTPFYAVKTTDGGALTWFAAVQTNTYEARRPGRGARLDLSDAKTLSSGKYFSENITTTNGRIYLAHVDNGELDVLAIRDQVLTVRGE